MSNWIDELINEIDTEVLDHKQVKFNTHKNRKLIIGKIKGLITNGVKENTVPKNPTRGMDSVITRPSPVTKDRGSVVMTEQMSNLADELHKGNDVSMLLPKK